MSRKLERFTGGNRHAFDDEMPSDKVWEKIAAGLPAEKKAKFKLTNFYRRSIAAAVLIIAGLGIFFFSVNKNDNPVVDVAAKADTSKDIKNIAPEYASEVNAIAKLVALKQDELKSLAPEQPQLYIKFTRDINQLDSSYKFLKNQLSATPNREMLIEAMIQNLQLQVEILNQQLNIINNIKKSKKESHEKFDKTI